MSENEKNVNEESNLEPIKDNELDSVSGGKGLVDNDRTAIGGKNIRTNGSSFL